MPASRTTAWSSEAGREDVERCILCGESSGEVLFTAVDRLHRRPGTFPVVSCDRCGLVRVSPRPDTEAIQQYYPADYYSYHSTPTLPSDETTPSWRTRARDLVRSLVLRSEGYPVEVPSWLPAAVAAVAVRWFRLPALFSLAGFPPYRPGGRILDVGAGEGAFLRIVGRYGWSTTGIDVSPNVASSAGHVDAPEILVGDFTTYDLAGRNFDVVHMSHVLEHFHDPRAALEKAFEVLAPDGLLYVETPNVDSAGRRMCGRYWFPWDVPRHLWLFDVDVLVALVGSVGFDVEHVWTTLQPRLFEQEYAYRNEEAGRDAKDRWSVPPRHRPRVWWRRLRRWVAWRRNIMSGDVVHCWARKPAP